jgi:acetyl-CoA acetyltransferase
MRALTAGPSGEIFSETAQRLLRWGMIEREAYMLARCVRLAADATDTACEDAVILALVAASEAVSGRADVTLVGGRRCDVQRRLEGRA